MYLENMNYKLLKATSIRLPINVISNERLPRDKLEDGPRVQKQKSREVSYDVMLAIMKTAVEREVSPIDWDAEWGSQSEQD